MRRPLVPVILAATLFVLAGGFVHLRDWLEIYRLVPEAVPGSAVVRVGFPINVAVSLVSAGALVASLFVARRFTPWVIAGSVLFQLASLATLVQTRMGSVFGWSEKIWTLGAKQTLALEIGALVCLAAIVAVGAAQPKAQVVPVRARRSS